MMNVVGQVTLSENQRTIDAWIAAGNIDSTLYLYGYYDDTDPYLMLPSNLKHLKWLGSGKLFGFAPVMHRTLPILPNSLLTLICERLELTELPTLPPNLSILKCRDNLIRKLPPLSNNITDIDCSDNLLIELPLHLPYCLEELRCCRSGIHDISHVVLHSTLKLFDCSENNLVALPFLPPNLISLRCEFNCLTELPRLPSTLQNLYCSNNVGLVLPYLPYGLQCISCKTIGLRQLPRLPSTLKVIACSHNNIKYVDHLPEDLIEFICHDNGLEQMPLLPNTLAELSFDGNDLIEHPILFPPSLSKFRCFDQTFDNTPDGLELYIIEVNKVRKARMLASVTHNSVYKDELIIATLHDK